MATIDDILSDPGTSRWLTGALVLALKRDPVQATHDAELLAHLLRDRLEAAQRAAVPVAGQDVAP